MIGGQTRLIDAASSIAGMLTDTTDNSSLENSGLTNGMMQIQLSETVDKHLVEPIYESREEDNQSKERQSSSMRDIPTFGKGSFRSSKSNSRHRASASQTREKLEVAGSGYLSRKELPRVEPLTVKKQVLKVNLVGLNMQEDSFIINQGEDPTLAIMGYCWKHKINDMALVLVIKKMIAREQERRAGKMNRASFLMNSFNGSLPLDQASETFKLRPPRQPTPLKNENLRTKTPSSRLRQLMSVGRREKSFDSDEKVIPRSSSRVLKFSDLRDEQSKTCTQIIDSGSRCIKKVGRLSPELSRLYLNEDMSKSRKRRPHILTDDLDRSTLGSVEGKKICSDLEVVRDKSKKIDQYLQKNTTNKQTLRASPSGAVKYSITSENLSKLPGSGAIKRQPADHSKTKKNTCHLHSNKKDKENIPPSKLNSYASIMKTLGIRKKPSYVCTDASRMFSRRPTQATPGTPTTKIDHSALKHLFSELDGDADGYISMESICLSSIPRDLLRELDPIFYELDDLDFSQFCAVIKKHRLTGEVVKHYMDRK